VAVNGRHQDSVERVAQQLEAETPRPVGPLGADVGTPAEAGGMVERVARELGRLDILFCNASGPPAAPFSHLTGDAFQRAVELNLLSTVHLARAAVPVMRKVQWGRIICLASVAAKQPVPGLILSTTARPGAPGLKVATVPKPSAGPGEVLIAVRHAGVCGTDLHIAEWDAWAQGRLKPPLVIGHEFAGEIVAVGEGVGELKAGQLVTAEGHIVCGHCLQCRTGNAHICRNTRIIGVDRDGAFAEYIVMPATNVLPLDGIPT